MSRTGKKLISIPEKVKISLNKKTLQIEGLYGQLVYEIPYNLEVKVLNKEQQLMEQFNSVDFSLTKEDAAYLQLVITSDDKKVRQLFGLSRTLINNMIIGVSQKFSKRLEMVGVGYKAQTSNNKLTLNVGFSHPIEMTIPVGIEVRVEKNVNINVEGISKELVGLFSSQIRSLRPPEPYKGKGIKYAGEYILRKAGKSAK